MQRTVKMIIEDGTDFQELEQKYLSLKESYEEAEREKQEAQEENERATISFAVHFDREVSVLKDHIATLIKERDKATIEAKNLVIKLENTKYELNRLQREHIKLQLEQEKYLEKIESFGERLKEVENEKKILNEELETLRTAKENTMNGKKKDESLLMGEEKNPAPRPPVTIKKSKVDDDYNVYEELGRGKFGVVKRVTKKTTNEEFAAKWVKVSSQTKDDVLKEIEIMGKLNHKRLVGLYDAYDVSRNIILIMEFITGGELFERIATEESVTEKECACYMRQLLEGLQYMHKQNIVHLDLKPENIVCVSKDTWDIKLIDFGLAKELKPGTSVKTMQGTPEFVAPEVINFDPVSLASDMWSVGVIAYILISGLSPFLGDDDNETLSYVTTAEYDFEDDAFNEISNEAKDFIEKLLQKPPSKRKTAEECLKHEWIKKNRGNNKIKTENLKKFLAKRRWQKSVNAVRAVRRLSSMSSLFNASAKGNSKSVAKLFEPKNETKTPLANKRELSKSTPSVCLVDNGQLSKRAMKILLDSDTEGSQSESGSMEQVNSTNVNDKEVFEGLFKENKEILDFLSSGLENKEQKNSLNRSTSQGKLGEISEEKDSSDEQAAKPSFSHPLPDVYTVPKGTPVLMMCTVAGCPTPNITWLRNDKSLKDEDADIRIGMEDNICTLSVGQCEVQDEGNYSCVAENHLGQTFCSTKLEVQVSPDFVHEMKDMTVAERKRVQLDVKISGTPLPTVEWYHNDVLLQEDRWTKLRKCTDDIYSLVIRSATPERRGNYKCVITNPLDTISCTAKLHIEGYSDDEDEDEGLDEGENEEEDEVDNCDNRAHVSLRQEDIELYYDIKEEIGKGRFGVIRYGIHKATGRDYAIKYIKVRKSQKDQFQQEIDIMNHLRHRRYIRLYEAFEEPRKLILVLELMRGGELLERVAESEYIAEHDIVKYVKQILEGVKDMHEKGVLHLDLKPQNIMFTTREGSNLKLIDFGLARKLSGEKDLKIFFGTPEFVAPEVVNYEVITPATDMWSVGVITYILLSGVSPFWNDDPDITLANVTRAEWRLPDVLFQSVSDDAKDFLSKLLSKDPSKRMKVENAFQHPWIQAAQNEDGKTNLISTKRLRKYQANQKGLVGIRDVALREPSNTTRKNPKDKIREDTKTKRNYDMESKGDAESHLATIIKERDELNQQLEAQLEKQNEVEEELFSVKTANKEQQSVLDRLEKRNKLLEERNRANQEATQRLIKLECDKRDIEDKLQQKERKYKDLSKKYENVREKADSYDALEEKVLHLEKERKTSQTNGKKMEEKLKQLRDENSTLQNQGVRGTRASITEENEEDVFDGEGKTSDKREMENKLELLSKELEIAQAEIRRISTVVSSQLEDLEEMERITEHKRKLETRCKGLEEQLVEQEHEGAQKEKEIDEMEEDIVDLQGKLQKSHNELRTVLEENKQLKKHLERLEKGREESKNGNATLVHENTETTRDVSRRNGHPLTNGFKESFEDGDNNNNNTKNLMAENGKLSAKCYELEKEMQDLMSKIFGGSIDENEEKEDSNTGTVREVEDNLVNKNADWESLSENMDLKQLRQLTKKLMKANKGLLSANEKLNHDKQQVEIQNEHLKNDYDKKIQALEKENETFKRSLKAGDNIDAAYEILNKTTIETLECELSNQQGKISDLKKTNNDLQQSKMEQRIEEESTQWRFEQKIETMNNDKSLLVLKYEKELEESYNFFSEEQSKFKRLYEERIVSVEKQNQHLKAQINELTRFNDSKKNNCDEHVKNLNELTRLHHEEIQEQERNMALTLSQQVHTLTSLNEQEKGKLTKENDGEINKLKNNCKDLNEVITNLQDQVTKYPELLGKNEDLKNELVIEKQRYEMLEKELEVQERTEKCKKCERLQSRVSELENELVALRELEEDNMLLASENEKLIEEIDIEREKVVLASNNNVKDSESKVKLEELDNEKRSSKLKENSKKFLKKKVSQLENDCKDLSRKLQSEILKSKQHELRINRETMEKEKVLQALLKARSSLDSKHGGQVNDIKQDKASSLLDSVIPVSVLDDKDTISIDEEKDNDYHMAKEELKKTQNRTHLLQTEIDRLRESYSNNLSKELEEMENKWTQRLRRECNAVHSEMAEEYRKQKEAWRKKESELHCVIKELQIQIEETETGRKRLEQECNELKGKLQNGTRGSEHISDLPGEEESTKNTQYTIQEEKDENLIQDSISDRDLRRVAYKLKKDQWSRLGKFLGLTDADIREIDHQKVGKEEKAFRVLCQWRTSVELSASNQVSLLALALEEIRRKDLAQFVMEHCMSGKYKKKLIGW